MLTHVRPAAAMPGGELHLYGTGLGPGIEIDVAGVSAVVELAREGHAICRVPEGVLPGSVSARRNADESNSVQVGIAVAMAENLHPVGNPAVDGRGTVYATLSGSRGQETPVSIFQIPPAPDGQTHELRPFVREILNPTGLAFGPGGDLYVSSRAEGTVLRVTPGGKVRTYAEGLGIATGIAFDEAGNLYVGDRSGTIFKIRPAAGGREQETFVFATLEPSISAYHLAFDSAGTLYVTGPTTASNQAIRAIDASGEARVFRDGLGRAQGMAFDVEDNLYVAASLGGERGIVRIARDGKAELAVSGANLVGLCFLPGRRAALATRDGVYEVYLGVEGRRLI